MIHLPAYAFPGKVEDNGPGDLDDWTNFTPNDKVRLQYWGGGIPVLGFSFGPWGNYSQASWDYLASLGYRDAVVRLYSPAQLSGPEAFIDMHMEGINKAVRAGFHVIGQIDNEPELEHNLGPVEYAAWAMKAVEWWKMRFPAYPVSSPPLSHNSSTNLQFLNAMDSIGLYQLVDYVNLHYYWGMTDGDKLPGCAFSPEWYHNRFPNKQLIVGECANWNNVSDVATVLDRWARLPYIRSYHVFVMSAQNNEHQARFYNDDLSNELYALARNWRELRRFPQGGSVVEPPVQPSNVDIAALRGQLDGMWNVYQKLLAHRDARFAEDDALAKDMFRVVVDTKRILGLQ